MIKYKILRKQILFNKISKFCMFDSKYCRCGICNKDRKLSKYSLVFTVYVKLIIRIYDDKTNELTNKLKLRLYYIRDKHDKNIDLRSFNIRDILKDNLRLQRFDYYDMTKGLATGWYYDSRNPSADLFENMGIERLYKDGLDGDNIADIKIISMAILANLIELESIEFY